VSVRKLITGNAAAAWGARLACADYVPAFPITPQTEIIEALGQWIDAGEIDSRMVMFESEHSMITAAGAAAATGVRVFTATSSQGLLYAMEMLYTVAGWRAPFVLVNVSRGLSSPITLESDHNDVLAARDTGFLQIHCSTVQEVLDSVLIAYRLGEDPRVRLPVLVNLDGFQLSFTREPAALPDAEAAAEYVGAFDPHGIEFRASHPVSQAVAVLGGGAYSYFRYELQRATEAAVPAYDDAATRFRAAFGRDHPSVETYRSDDAEVVFVMLGSNATKAKVAVDQLREDGQAVGLVRPRLFRPFPTQAIRAALAGKQAAAVIDQNLSMGAGGILHAELSAALYAHPGAPGVLTSFIGGLGGRDIQAEEFFEMAAVSQRAASDGTAPPMRLLYTRDELRELRKLQGIARAERNELRSGGGE
jgi:pyruvate ferredoxin oxidoreductase alpha subunit